jgi:hypothetical protein
VMMLSAHRGLPLQGFRLRLSCLICGMSQHSVGKCVACHSIFRLSALAFFNEPSQSRQLRLAVARSGKQISLSGPDQLPL